MAREGVLKGVHDRGAKFIESGLSIYPESRRIGWDGLRTHVSKYEVDTYLPIL